MFTCVMYLISFWKYGEQAGKADLMVLWEWFSLLQGNTTWDRSGCSHVPQIFSVSSNRNPTSYCLFSKENLYAHIVIKARGNTMFRRGLIQQLNHMIKGLGSFSLYSATCGMGFTLSLAPLEV